MAQFMLRFSLTELKGKKERERRIKAVLMAEFIYMPEGLVQLSRMPFVGSSVLSHFGSNSMQMVTHQLKLPFVMSNVEPVRTKIRKHFYRPSERLRLIKHGWETRLKTPNGRAIIMRRILKGRFVLTH